MVRMRKRFYGLLAILVMGWPFLTLDAAPKESTGRLLVFTTDFCPYCKEFKQTVGVSYAKTKLGKRFPMEVVDNFSPSKEWEELSWEIRFFPTFLVLDEKGKIQGQFRGYRGEEFFWSELETITAQMSARH